MSQWTYEADQKGGGGWRVYDSDGAQVAVILCADEDTAQTLVDGANLLRNGGGRVTWRRYRVTVPEFEGAQVSVEVEGKNTGMARTAAIKHPALAPWVEHQQREGRSVFAGVKVKPLQVIEKPQKVAPVP